MFHVKTVIFHVKTGIFHVKTGMFHVKRGFFHVKLGFQTGVWVSSPFLCALFPNYDQSKLEQAEALRELHTTLRGCSDAYNILCTFGSRTQPLIGTFLQKSVLSQLKAWTILLKLGFTI